MTSKSLLVIDDDPEIGNFVRDVAEQLNYRVEISNDPENFMDLYKRLEPDVIVLDIVMPKLDGIELIRNLAEMGCKAHLIIISGYNPLYLKSGRTLAEDWGIPEVTALPKPIELEKLESILAEA